ncbi:MAG: DUF4286 family protein [Bacteroidia bacterium]|nr:DUF4286 family protein [Bacteroidia bacterium]MCZ2276485.1 DUF4286 family protein [Bacteroidia bacterium]
MAKILYNVTVKVDHDIHSHWLEWLQQHHIPAVLETGCFTGYRLMRLISEPDDDGFTYSIQYTCKHLSAYERYINFFSEGLRQQSEKLYKGKTVIFRTVLEYVDEFGQ